MSADLQAAREWLDHCTTVDALHAAWSATPNCVRHALDSAGDGFDARYRDLQRASVHHAQNLLGADAG